MAEFDFFATEDDHLELVELFVEAFQAEFFLDGTESPPTAIGVVSDVMNLIRGNEHDPRFFVVSRQWQIESLSVKPVAGKDGKTRFHIRQREGGPAIDFLARRLRKVGNANEIVPSWLGDFPSYSSSTSDAAISRPALMADCFDAARKLICRRGMRTTVIETSKPGPWLRPDARIQFERGAWLRVGDWHHTPGRSVTGELRV